MYGYKHGRFTSPDPLLSSGRIENPQSWNRYPYVLNNPLNLIDPSGLYDFAPDTDDKYKEKFRNAYNKLKELLADPKLDKKLTESQISKLKAAFAAFGTEGDGNGVTVGFVNNVKNGIAEAVFPKDDSSGMPNFIKEKSDGTFVPNIHVNFEKGIDADTMVEAVAHEGDHTSNLQALGVQAIRMAMSTDQVLDNPALAMQKFLALPGNLTQYDSEKSAYQVSAAVQQYQGRETDIWKRGWTETDQRTITAINDRIRRDYDGIGPKNPGERYLHISKPKKK